MIHFLLLLSSMLCFSYVPQLEYCYPSEARSRLCVCRASFRHPSFFASVQVYIQSGKYIKYDIFMFQLLELLSKSTLIEILNNAIQQESGIHGMSKR